MPKREYIFDPDVEQEPLVLDPETRERFVRALAESFLDEIMCDPQAFKRKLEATEGSDD